MIYPGKAQQLRFVPVWQNFRQVVRILLSFYTHLLFIEYIYINFVWLANICFSVILLNFEHGCKFIWLKYVAMVMQHKQTCMSIQNSYHEELIIVLSFVRTPGRICDTKKSVWITAHLGCPLCLDLGVLHLFYFYSLMCLLSFSASAWKGRVRAAFGARAGIPSQ